MEDPEIGKLLSSIKNISEFSDEKECFVENLGIL